MTAPYVLRLISDIDKCVDQEYRALLCAELGCYWARTGDFDKADRLRVELRSAYGDGKNIRISILLMSLEGILLYFKDLNPGSYDRLVRAKFLSIASKDKDLISFTSAWVAHLDFNRNNFQSMVDSIVTCFDALTERSFSAECRVALVLGDVMLYTRNEVASKIWYERARSLAIKMGDQASIEALTFNRAALKIFNAQIDLIEYQMPPTNIADVISELRTATNYQIAANLKSLDELLQLADVQVTLLKQDFTASIHSIERLLDVNSTQISASSLMILKADLIRSYAECGKLPELTEFINFIEKSDIDSRYIDDRVLLLASLGKSAKLSGFSDLSIELSNRLIESMILYRKNTIEINVLIARYNITDSINILN